MISEACVLLTDKSKSCHLWWKDHACHEVAQSDVGSTAMEKTITEVQVTPLSCNVSLVSRGS